MLRNKDLKIGLVDRNPARASGAYIFCVYSWWGRCCFSCDRNCVVHFDKLIAYLVCRG